MALVRHDGPVRMEGTVFLVGNGSNCRGALPLPFPVKDQLSLLARRDAGMSFVVSVKSVPIRLIRISEM